MNKKRVFILITVFVFSIISFAKDKIILPVMYGQSKSAIEKFISSEDIKGASIAVEEINESGGLLGKEVEILDLGVSTQEDAFADVEKVLKRNDILAVIGYNTSNLSLLMAPKFQDKKIIMISPISTNTKVTEVGDYIYRVCFTDPFQGKVMARFALDDLNAKTAVLFTKVSSQFSVGLAKFFKEEFEKQGEILGEVSYLGKEVSYTDSLEKINKLNPDVIFVPGHGRDSGMILKQAKSMGIDSVFLGGDGWGKGVLGIGGAEAVEGHYFSNHWHVESKNSKSENFISKYWKKYGEGAVASSAALSYDAVMILAEAVKRANSFDNSKIKAELDKINDFNGVTGTIDFSKGRDPYNKDAVILKYESGEIKYHKTITR